MWKRFIQLTVALLVLTPLVVIAQDTVDGTVKWDPPTTGSSPVLYNLLASIDDGPFEPFAQSAVDSVDVVLEYGRTYIFVVYAVDDQGRNGPQSPLSEAYYIDAGPPGACGIPFLRY